MNERKSLSDILRGANRESIEKAWASTKAAGEMGPLPAGEYTAKITKGELFTSRIGTPGYKLTFKVTEGDFAGRLFWEDVWFTPLALPKALRDLRKIGVEKLEQLDLPIPQGIVCAVSLSLRKDDDGNKTNKVQMFTVVRIDPPEVDPFGPSDGGPNQ